MVHAAQNALNASKRMQMRRHVDGFTLEYCLQFTKELFVHWLCNLIFSDVINHFLTMGKCPWV